MPKLTFQKADRYNLSQFFALSTLESAKVEGEKISF